MSKLWYDKLPKELQAAVDEAGRQADREIYPWAVDALAKSRQAWTSNGGTLARLSAEEHGQLMKTLQPVGAEVTAKNALEKALFDLLAKAAAGPT